jgi:hypothetical protein
MPAACQCLITPLLRHCRDIQSDWSLLCAYIFQRMAFDFPTVVLSGLVLAATLTVGQNLANEANKLKYDTCNNHFLSYIRLHIIIKVGLQYC